MNNMNPESPAHIHNQNPSLNKLKTYNTPAKTPPPKIIVNKYPFILSKTNVLTVVLLKPYFSSMTKVL